MPMPTMVNGRPVRTGSWEPAEDQALAEWQAKLGNRCALVPGRIRGAQNWRFPARGCAQAIVIVQQIQPICYVLEYTRG